MLSPDPETGGKKPRNFDFVPARSPEDVVARGREVLADDRQRALAVLGDDVGDAERLLGAAGRGEVDLLLDRGGGRHGRGLGRRGGLLVAVVVAAAEHAGEDQDAADDHEQDGDDDEHAAEARERAWSARAARRACSASKASSTSAGSVGISGSVSSPPTPAVRSSAATPRAQSRRGLIGLQQLTGRGALGGRLLAQQVVADLVLAIVVEPGTRRTDRIKRRQRAVLDRRLGDLEQARNLSVRAGPWRSTSWRTAFWSAGRSSKRAMRRRRLTERPPVSCRSLMDLQLPYAPEAGFDGLYGLVIDAAMLDDERGSRAGRGARRRQAAGRPRARRRLRLDRRVDHLDGDLVRGRARAARAAQGLSNQTSSCARSSAGRSTPMARARHRGRTTWVWEVEISDDERRLCALVRMTIAVR